jgi:transposase-like protein
MPAGRPSKFTAERRTRILEALQVGASRATAAAIGGVGERTLKRWIADGQTAREGSAKRKFVEEVEAAEAHPKARALGIIYNAMQDRPELAWKFIERREHGFAPPIANVAPPAAPTLIQLNFPGAPLPAVRQVIEGEVVDEQNSLPDAATPDGP